MDAAIPTGRPRGRRPAGVDTRGAIVTAARAEFAERGYEAASMRSVARRAGVDPALVRHYFPDRGELFAVSVLPAAANPVDVAGRVVAGGLPGIGQRLLTEVLQLWSADDGEGFRAAVGLMAGGVDRPQALLAYLGRTVFEQIGRLVAPDEAPVRVGLMASQVAGLLVVRHVIRLEPVASMPVAQLAAFVGPTIDRYLTAPLPELA
ncbi:MAG TPA: TetR family transcriptional regulator [Cellulomonas sp.]